VQIEPIACASERLRQETAALCQSWLKARRTATTFSWLLALDPFLHEERKRFFAARNAAGELVGFLAASPIPARDGWYLEDFLRRPDAPQGTADLLVLEALTKFAAEGARLATLGTSPLAPEGEREVPTVDYLEKAVETVAARLSRLYNFEGLRRFKAKFAPTWWESEYALVPRGVIVPPLVTYALLRAVVPGGLTRLFARQLARIVHPL
jgi:phosphatidylglycerol lysyltransferase